MGSMSRLASGLAQSTKLIGCVSLPGCRCATHSFQPVTNTISGSTPIAHSHCSARL